MKSKTKFVFNMLLGLLLLFGVGIYSLAKLSEQPVSMNMANMPSGKHDMQQMSSSGISVTKLTEDTVESPVKTFDLTAEEAVIDIGNGKTIQAWTFNGTVPGPEIRVQEGDRVIVHVKNTLKEGVTIHWHGVELPNAEDGVAGVTQDAIPPGSDFTYNFIAKHAGTYWYHSHQESEKETGKGLYGAFIVETKHPTTVYQREIVSILHEWDRSTFTVDGTSLGAKYAAKPGDLVLLRLINSGDATYNMTLTGSPFLVSAIDAHDINEPTELNERIIEIGSGQRYDLVFRMPESSGVKLVNVDKNEKQSNIVKRLFFTSSSTAKNRMLQATFGDGEVTGNVNVLAQQPFFDMTTYGSPVLQGNDPLSINAKFDAQYDLTLGNMLGFFNGVFTMKFTINGQTFPNIPMLIVKKGDWVRIHIQNNSPDNDHPIHLHGHSFKVLTHNGEPLSGSPIYLSTILVKPQESYDIAFVADNPGLWMIHCHILGHAANGMDMMVNYEGVSTPYSVGSKSGNRPD
ncbi:multicopper oxidase family protein [Paenibacillus cremeus]|uniref:Multicopper oxidase family protein n=1 Tax=Paenibacillus cremeus TaxID=2163881 RepID=A0A559K4G8_9BACL|nr:multicopper oxidase family protein [Paenibacillus cremeus]TVY07031.1 multicopper oxidase family protein [Paenibacillus cremeus]